MKNYLFLLLIVMFTFISCSDDPSNPISGDDDTESPSAISDFSVGFTTANSATFYLTASGDDGLDGRARTYEVRYATTLINSANYAQAASFISPNQPHVGTADDTIIVTGLLPKTQYYFAVKVADEAENWSPISNVVSAQTLLSGNWTIYNTDNSDILANQIDAIELDGVYKYISTPNGVSTYDNTSWNTIYDSSSITIIIDTFIIDVDTTIDTTRFSSANSIAIESASRVWLGTQNSGVALVEGDSTIFYTQNDSGSITSTRDILISQNKLWVGTLSNGLHSFNLDGSDIWEQYDLPTSSALPGDGIIECLAVDASNSIWSGLNLHGTTVLNNSTFTTYGSPEFTSQAVWDIDASASTILFGTDEGAFVFENNNWTQFVATDSGLPDAVITAVVIDNQGMFWFGTRIGLASYDGITWTVYNTTNSFLPDNWINVLEFDIFGNLWIGTNNGLARFSN